MVRFTTSLKRFASQGEKTGWTYIEVPQDLAGKLVPGNRKGFRVKGKIDKHPIKFVALLPMGGGNFIMPVNAEMRKGIRKKLGAMVTVSLEVDSTVYKLDKDLVTCLNDDPPALKFFKELPKSHQNYFSKWIESAKTEQTKARRIALTVSAMSKRMSYGEMLREYRENR